MRHALIPLALAILPQTAPAQTVAEAAASNLQLAAELCLRATQSNDQMIQALTAAGFQMSSTDGDAFEFTGPHVWGVFVVFPGDTFCTVQSSEVNLSMARAIGQALADRLFPGAAVPGRPSSPANAPLGPCDGYTLWGTRPVTTVSYAQAGNSGECIDDGTSAILIRK